MDGTDDEEEQVQRRADHWHLVGTADGDLDDGRRGVIVLDCVGVHNYTNQHVEKRIVVVKIITEGDS